MGDGEVGCQEFSVEGGVFVLAEESILEKKARGHQAPQRLC